MTRQGRAAVVGGSMGGLFAAIALRRAGWDVTVFERAGPELASRGAGIVTHGPMLALLAGAGLACEERDLGVDVPGRRLFDRTGAILSELDFPQTLTTWSRLREVLRNAVPDAAYHSRKALTSMESSASGVGLHFADGSTFEGDLVVAADGIQSTARALLLPGVEPVYAGYVAWRGLVQESVLAPDVQTELCDWFGFALPPGEQMLGYPVAGADGSLTRGSRGFNTVWYRPAPVATATAELMIDGPPGEPPLSIPPDRIRPAAVAAMREAARAVLPPVFQAVVEATERPLVQPIVDLESPTLAPDPHGRVALVGDAGFVARPHVGMGVLKAMGDGEALARALGAHPGDRVRALAQFDAERVAFGRAIVARGRRLGTGLADARQAPLPLATVLRQTAAVPMPGDGED